MAAGCISTELAPATSLAIACAENVSQSVGQNAVVLLETQVGNAITYCSGVVVAPRLVATVLGCVVGLNDPEARDPRQTASSVIQIATASADYTSICDRQLEWRPREDGSFYAPLGRSVDRSAIGVEVVRDLVIGDVDGATDTQSYSVEAVFSSRATTNCKDAIAVLVLESPISVSPVPLRLGESNQVGEFVSMVGYCVTEKDGMFVTNGLDSYIEEVTFEDATEGAPPRALRLDQNLSLFASGGAVLSADTGALVALIGSGTYPGCGEDTSGTTIAFRVGPFEKLFMDAAQYAEESLHVELRADLPAVSQPPPCSAL